VEGAEAARGGDGGVLSSGSAARSAPTVAAAVFLAATGSAPAVATRSEAFSLQAPQARRSRDYRALMVRTLSVVVVLSAWEVVARSGLVSPLFLSSPSQVAMKVFQLFASGAVWPHLRASAQEALMGFGLAMLIGIPIGIAMGRIPLVRLTLEPFVAVLYSSPSVAFLPLLIIWLGIGLWSKAVLVFVGAVVVMIVNTETGVSTVDARLVEMARAFTAGERQVLMKVVLPAAAPFLLAGVRLAVGRVLIMVVVAEFYASTAGLGYLIFQGAAQFDATLVFAGVTLLAGAGVALSHLLRAVERRLQPWREPERA
jgi:ABC-type nitrate/sulfonate/bicarbonate transport system permease component